MRGARRRVEYDGREPDRAGARREANGVRLRPGRPQGVRDRPTGPDGELRVRPPGPLTRRTTALGEQIVDTYDPVGPLTERTTPSGTTSYAYNRRGDVVGLEDCDSRLQLGYDALSRLTSATTGNPGNPQVTSR